MRITPTARCSSIAFPIVGDPGSAEITCPAINHEELAMRPEIHGHIDEAEDFQLHASSSHQVHRAAMKAIAAEGILEKMHFHP